MYRTSGPKKNRMNTRSFEFDNIYVNGCDNPSKLKLDNENLPAPGLRQAGWKVRLIEEEFMKRMWDVEGV